MKLFYHPWQITCFCSLRTSLGAADGCQKACGMAISYWLLLGCIKSRSGKFNQIYCCTHPAKKQTPRRAHRDCSSAAAGLGWHFLREKKRHSGPSLKPWRKEEIHSRWLWDVNWFLWETFNAEKRRCYKSWRRIVIQRYALMWLIIVEKWKSMHVELLWHCFGN